MKFESILKLFRSGNVSVFGLRGTGKDVLFGNVIARRRLPYISNVPYGYDYIPFNYDDIALSGNTFKDIVSGNVKEYLWPHPFGSDIYFSDCGIYFPAHYCNVLNNLYPSLPTFWALSRQLARINIHSNSQQLSRVWDKIREQSEIYLMCRYCFVLFGKIVIQGIRTYDKYQSAADRVKPFTMKRPRGRDKLARTNYEIHRDSFINQHGIIRNRFLIYLNRSKHDTYYFCRYFCSDEALINSKQQVYAAARGWRRYVKSFTLLGSRFASVFHKIKVAIIAARQRFKK